jgi:Peptidase A4 family
MQPKSVWGVMALLGVVAAFMLPGVVLVAPVASGAAHLSLATENPSVYGQPGQYLSYNWAGYAAFDQANHTVTKVSGTWVEPAVTCPSSGTTYAAFWVGIDGFTSDAVEQDGTLAVCHLGVASYQAWWELFPTNSIQPIKMTISPGDTISAFVIYHATHTQFTMNVTDVTTGATFSITAKQAPRYSGNSEENSAECIIERPAEISHGVITLLHLSNFGTVTFNACQTTISGTTDGVGNFSPAAFLYMVGGPPLNTTKVDYLASPSGPSNIAKWSFTTTWQNYK